VPSSNPHDPGKLLEKCKAPFDMTYCTTHGSVWPDDDLRKHGCIFMQAVTKFADFANYPNVHNAGHVLMAVGLWLSYDIATEKER